MNKKDIIRMAQETGVTAERVRDLVNFAALVASAEREACAKVCEVIAQKMEDEGEGPTGNIGWVDDCATAIRARGQV